jgi:predicted transcriptional regulator
MMHGKRRDKLEIMVSILSLCKQNNATKTRIVYQSNLNFKTAGMYLDWLMKSNLVEQDENHFKLTTKGNDLLSSLHEMSPLFNGEFGFESHSKISTAQRDDTSQRALAGKGMQVAGI